jgi:hypothetical protein
MSEPIACLKKERNKEGCFGFQLHWGLRALKDIANEQSKTQNTETYCCEVTRVAVFCPSHAYKVPSNTDR